MKTFLLITIVLCIAINFSSCEDVIEVNLPENEPRLVVDGLVRVDTTKQFADVKIKITQTSDFFGEFTNVSDIETIYIYYGVENEYGDIVTGAYSNLTELEPGSGIYEPDPTFSTEQRISAKYLSEETMFWLFIRHQGRLYIARTPYATSVAIDSLSQGNGILLEEDDKEVIVSFTDNPEKENYYVFDFDFGNFLTSEDSFYEGQPFSFSYFYDDNLEAGQEITVSILGANQTFYNYMNLLLEQAEGGFGPFETPAATVRGNIFDFTDIDNINNFNNVEQPDNYALGYFIVSQSFSRTITIQ